MADEYEMRDPLIVWRDDQLAQERQFARERVKRKLAETRQTRQAQAALALPSQLAELEQRLRHEFNRQLAEALSGVGAVVEAIENKLNRLQAKQNDSTTVATAVSAVERGFDKITAKLDRLERAQASGPVSTSDRRLHGELN